jgi:hypothetical protein
MPGERTSVYLAAAVKASGVPLAELVRCGLAAGNAEAAQPGAKNPTDNQSFPRRPPRRRAGQRRRMPDARLLVAGHPQVRPAFTPVVHGLRHRRDLQAGTATGRRTRHPPQRSLSLCAPLAARGRETVTPLRTHTEETPGATTSADSPHGTHPTPRPPRPSPTGRPTATHGKAMETMCRWHGGPRPAQTMTTGTQTHAAAMARHPPRRSLTPHH